VARVAVQKVIGKLKPFEKSNSSLFLLDRKKGGLIAIKYCLFE